MILSRIIEHVRHAMCGEIARYDGHPCRPTASGKGDEIFGMTDAPKG